MSEFEIKLSVLETRLRLERGDVLREGPRTPEFSELAVNYLAQELAEKVRKDRQEMHENKGYIPRLREEYAQDIGKLLRYVAQWHKPIPDSLLTGVLEALGVINEKALVTNLGAFQRASALDGEADARGEKLSQLSLAEGVDVDRKTIRRWRNDPLYQKRRKVAELSTQFWNKETEWNKNRSQ